jgi:hypothetical protein
MTKFSTLLDEILAEAVEKAKLPKPKSENNNKKLHQKEPSQASPPKPKSEKHNSTYHQDEPVQFKKPVAPKEGKDGKVSEKDGQKEVNDQNEETSKVALGDTDITEDAKLGSGERFKNLSKSISKEKGVKDPDAVAASIGRKKYGAKKMGQMSHHENKSPKKKGDK